MGSHRHGPTHAIRLANKGGRRIPTRPTYRHGQHQQGKSIADSAKPTNMVSSDLGKSNTDSSKGTDIISIDTHPVSSWN
uniref:Uncharacterized protein n=1 Tax=Ascaris lumbricoides TaxID=6252 RepID=A0A0M3HG32_ASCLU